MYRFASWFDQNATWIWQPVLSQAVLAPLALLFIAEMGIPTIVTNDLLIASVGFGVAHDGALAFWITFVLAQLAVLGGASALFTLGNFWGAWIVTKLQRFLFIQPKHIKRAEKLLEKHGVWAIIIGRHIPGVRIPLTIFAAAAGVKYRAFLLGTLVSTAPWVLLYLYLGQRYGTDVQEAITKYTGLSVIVACTIAAILVLLHFWKPRHKPPTEKLN